MINVALQCENLLGEGPVWDSVGNRILWVDILDRCIHSYDLENELHKKIVVDGMVGAIAIESNTTVIAAIANRLTRLNLVTGDISVIKKFDFDYPGIRFNDGKCDNVGRFWIGTMSNRGEKNKGNLYCYTNKAIEKKYQMLVAQME